MDMPIPCYMRWSGCVSISLHEIHQKIAWQFNAWTSGICSLTALLRELYQTVARVFYRVHSAQTLPRQFCCVHSTKRSRDKFVGGLYPKYLRGAPQDELTPRGLGARPQPCTTQRPQMPRKKKTGALQTLPHALFG